MIEAANIRVPLARAGETREDEMRSAREALRRRLHLAPDDLTSVEVRRRSIDARKKDQVKLVFTLRATLRGGTGAERALVGRLRQRHDDKNVSIVDEAPICGLRPSRRRSASVRRVPWSSAPGVRVFSALWRLPRRASSRCSSSAGTTLRDARQPSTTSTARGASTPSQTSSTASAAPAPFPTASWPPARAALRTAPSSRRSWRQAPTRRSSGTPIPMSQRRAARRGHAHRPPHRGPGR